MARQPDRPVVTRAAVRTVVAEPLPDKVVVVAPDTTPVVPSDRGAVVTPLPLTVVALLASLPDTVAVVVVVVDTTLPLAVVVLPDPLPDIVALPPDTTPVVPSERDAVVTPLALAAVVLPDPAPDTVVLPPDKPPVVAPELGALVTPLPLAAVVVLPDPLPDASERGAVVTPVRVDTAVIAAVRPRTVAGARVVDPQPRPSPPHLPHASTFAEPPHTPAQSNATTQFRLQSTSLLSGYVHGPRIVASRL